MHTKAEDKQTHSSVVEDLPNEGLTIQPRPEEHGGSKGLEPTRYGDWERNGRCTDF